MSFSALKAMRTVKVFLAELPHLAQAVQAVASAPTAIHFQMNTQTVLLMQPLQQVMPHRQ